MRTLVNNAVNVRVVSQLVAAVFAVSVSCCGVAQEAAGWAGAKVTKTDLLTGETNYGKFSYFFHTHPIVRWPSEEKSVGF